MAESFTSCARVLSSCRASCRQLSSSIALSPEILLLSPIREAETLPLLSMHDRTVNLGVKKDRRLGVAAPPGCRICSRNTRGQPGPVTGAAARRARLRDLCLLNVGGVSHTSTCIPTLSSEVRSSFFFYQNMASRASKIMNKSRPGPLFFRARFWPSAGPRSGETAIATWNLLSLFSNLPGVYKQPALPSGAAQPEGPRGTLPSRAAGTRGAGLDIQAVAEPGRDPSRRLRLTRTVTYVCHGHGVTGPGEPHWLRGSASA